LCGACGKEPPLAVFRADAKHAVCESCYLKHVARERLGSKRLWPALKQQLEMQGYKCAYTGDALILGVNDSADHKFPISRFPEQASDATNIEWVRRDINGMKRDRTPDEFRQLLSQILEFRFGLGWSLQAQTVDRYFFGASRAVA
jgi:hypothetical protein